MKQRLRYLIFPVMTLILEILPYGAVCNFASSPTERLRKTFSYFDMTPFGYANFTPLITAILSCVLLLLLVLYCLSGKEQFALKARTILLISIPVSFGPLLFGMDYFSLVGLLISLTLIGEFVLLSYGFSKKNP